MASKFLRVIILDQSDATVSIATIEHNKSDDLEVSVSDYLETLDKNLDECSWMELPDDFSISDIEEEPRRSVYLVARAGQCVRVVAISERAAERVASADYYGDKSMDWKDSEYMDEAWDVVEL